MQKIILTLVMMGLSGLIFSGQAIAGKVEQHQVWQQQRIRQGIKSGQLTPYEIRYLWQGQEKIHRFKKSFWRDGRLTHRERSLLVLWLDRADRHIFELKHNERRRPVHWRRAAYPSHRRF